MIKRQCHYNLGDLVKFTVVRQTEEYKHHVEKVGIVVKQSLRMTKDNVFKIKAGDEHYWIPRPRITLLSKAASPACK